MERIYIREDIYYCSKCGHFYDIKTDRLVDVPYTEMTAEFAMKVMRDRQVPFRPCHARNRARKARKTDKGFGS